MASDTEHGHFRLVASMKEAENDAQNEESLLLVQLVTAATQDDNPKYTLREIYDALREARTWVLLDPLNLLPLLISSDKDAATDMIYTISEEGNAKEAVIAAQEVLERLIKETNEKEETTPTSVDQLIRLLRVCRGAIPRLQLRTRGPEETLRPLLAHLSSAIETVVPHGHRNDGQDIISSVSGLIHGSALWVSKNLTANQIKNQTADDPKSQTANEMLLSLLFTTLSVCAADIRSSLAQRRFQTYKPRLVLPLKENPELIKGEKIMKDAFVVAQTLDITQDVLASQPLSLGKLILIAHSPLDTFLLTPEYLQKILPMLTSSLHQNTATDESLAILLTFVSSSTTELSDEIVDPVATLIIPIASAHPDPQLRHIAFRILSALLAREPPPIHLAHLSNILTDSPFPQMRVAAVGLVKEAFLSAITSPQNPPSPFASSALMRALGPILFSLDPPDLLASPTQEVLKKFLESSEPARLTECLAFYYVLLMRDTGNLTGVRDRDTLRTVEKGLLFPIRNAVGTWLQDSSILEDHHALMPLASLETSIERVDGAVASLRA